MSQSTGDAQIIQILKETSDLTQMSLDTSRRLLDLGFHGPSIVWSVRSVEVFFKSFLLLPHFVRKRGDFNKAKKEANKFFGASNWPESVALVNEVFGPLDPMTTVEGRDAMKVWIKDVVWLRGEVVHGRSEGDGDSARWALGYAEQLVTQVKLRLITSGKHPLSDDFKRAFHDLQSAYKRTRAASHEGPATPEL